MTKTRRTLATAAAPALAALAAFACATEAAAQTTQSVNAGISVMQPVLIVTKNTDLSFGTVTRPTSGSGTVSIDANSGNVSVTGGISVVAGNSATRATFTVTGTPNANIQVTYPNSFNLTRSGGAETLPITLTSSMGGGQISGSGTVNFSMGGQVTLSSATVAGAYQGSYDVTVAYN